MTCEYLHTLRYYGDNYISEYVQNGQTHRISGPALVSVYSHGTSVDVYYMRKGQVHNAAGPAYLSYQKGRLVSSGYYLQGESVSAHDPSLEHAP